MVWNRLIVITLGMTEVGEPYPFQKKVAELLLAGRNVILQAPTGAGKTRAALLPLLHSIEHVESGFPHKCIYAVPRRVLANQFVEDWREIIEGAGRADRLPVSILTGESPEDSRFEAGLTFATIDQVLSSYLLTPYSLSRRLANLNAGAIVASYLVFDEFHLFDPRSTLPTTLEVLRQLNGVAPFVLMTATFSQEMLGSLAERLKAEIVPGTEDERAEIQKLPSQRKTRRYHAADGPLSARAVLEHHTGGRTLVVCNTVARAQALYQEIKARHDNTRLLHSRFLKEDRREREQQVGEIFGENGDENADLILVATQVVEVGLDITCRTLVTELAPANAIVQRAGRCARYRGEEGDVFVYSQVYDPRQDTSEVLDLREAIAPYGNPREKEDGFIKTQFARTWDWLCENSANVCNFQLEQDLVSFVHSELDDEIIKGIGATSGLHRQEMYSVMRGESAGAARLIRNIRAFRVTIHSDWRELLANPLGIEESFSLSAEVMYGALRGLLDRAQGFEGEAEPLVAVYEETDDQDQDEDRSVYGGRFVNGRVDLAGAALVVIHPDLATYSPDVGLLLDRGGVWECALPQKVQRDESDSNGYKYRLESYQDHVRLVWRAFEHIAWPEVAAAASRLERALRWSEGKVRRAAELAVLLHDVGKLSVVWQGRAHEWQQIAANPQCDDFMIAHTDRYLPQHERLRWPRATHAGEGAYASLMIVDRYLGDIPGLARAACTAILRHHAPFANDRRDYELTKQAPDIVADTLVSLGECEAPPAPFIKPRPGIELGQFVSQPEDEPEFLAYVLLVRVLRRADQIGTRWGSQAAD